MSSAEESSERSSGSASRFRGKGDPSASRSSARRPRRRSPSLTSSFRRQRDPSTSRRSAGRASRRSPSLASSFRRKRDPSTSRLSTGLLSMSSLTRKSPGHHEATPEPKSDQEISHEDTAVKWISETTDADVESIEQTMNRFQMQQQTRSEMHQKLEAQIMAFINEFVDLTALSPDEREDACETRDDILRGIELVFHETDGALKDELERNKKVLSATGRAYAIVLGETAESAIIEQPKAESTPPPPALKSPMEALPAGKADNAAQPDTGKEEKAGRPKKKRRGKKDGCDGSASSGDEGSEDVAERKRPQTMEKSNVELDFEWSAMVGNREDASEDDILAPTPVDVSEQSPSPFAWGASDVHVLTAKKERFDDPFRDIISESEGEMSTRKVFYSNTAKTSYEDVQDSPVGDHDPTEQVMRLDYSSSEGPEGRTITKLRSLSSSEVSTPIPLDSWLHDQPVKVEADVFDERVEVTSEPLETLEDRELLDLVSTISKVFPSENTADSLAKAVVGSPPRGSLNGMTEVKSGDDQDIGQHEEPQLEQESEQGQGQRQWEEQEREDEAIYPRTVLYMSGSELGGDSPESGNEIFESLQEEHVQPKPPSVEKNSPARPLVATVQTSETSSPVQTPLSEKKAAKPAGQSWPIRAIATNMSAGSGMSSEDRWQQMMQSSGSRPFWKGGLGARSSFTSSRSRAAGRYNSTDKHGTTQKRPSLEGPDETVDDLKISDVVELPFNKDGTAVSQDEAKGVEHDNESTASSRTWDGITKDSPMPQNTPAFAFRDVRRPRLAQASTAVTAQDLTMAEELKTYVLAYLRDQLMAWVHLFWFIVSICHWVLLRGPLQPVVKGTVYSASSWGLFTPSIQPLPQKSQTTLAAHVCLLTTAMLLTKHRSLAQEREEWSQANSVARKRFIDYIYGESTKCEQRSAMSMYQHVDVETPAV